MFFIARIESSQNANSQNASSKGIRLYLRIILFLLKQLVPARDPSAKVCKMLIMNVQKYYDTCMFVFSLTVSRCKIKHGSYPNLSKWQKRTEIWEGKGNQKIISF